MDDAPPLLAQMDNKSEMYIATDNHLRSNPLVTTKRAHSMPCTPRALPKRHEGPESTSLQGNDR